MRIHVRTDITMQTMIPGDAIEVFGVIDRNRINNNSIIN